MSKPHTFRPARGLVGPHLQTIFAALGRRPPRVPLERARWELPDGDFLDVDLLHGKAQQPRVVIMHGLEGSSAASYVRTLLHELHVRHCSAVAVNFRGCSGELNRHARFYHSGETSDLRFIVQKLAAERGKHGPICLVGYSLGGNMVLKYLGEEGEAATQHVHRAAAISVPYDLAACAGAVDAAGAMTLIYRERFLRRLRRKALAKAMHHPAAFDIAGIKAARTFADFDARVTAPMFKFASAEDYWTRSSACHFVENIRVPSLLIQAADDPLVPVSSVPTALIAQNPALTLELLPTGGHVGFVGGTLLRPTFYAERRVADWLVA